MFKKQRLTVLSVSILLALLFAAVMPISALADDVVPPTDVPAAVEEPVVEEPVVEEPVAEAPVVEEPVAEAPAVEEPMVEEESVAETSSESLAISDVLDAVPEGTDLVVLGETGDALPLVTEAAAETILAGDPMWCPSGKTPADGVAGGCTASFSSFGALITELSNGTGTDAGAGTIYVAFDYNAATAGDAGNSIVFDYDAMHLTNLVFQGGWNFSSNAVVGKSTIDLGLANKLNFHDWEGILVLNDIVLTNSESLRIDGRGLDGETTVNVVINNVDVTNTNYGSIVNTEGSVAIKGSKFTNNGDWGSFIWQSSGVTITDSVFSGNAERGVVIWIRGDATISNSTFNDNVDGGADISATRIAITNGNFSNNMNGFSASSNLGGSITLTDVIATGNSDRGAIAYANYGDIIINGGNFSNNVLGLSATAIHGSVTLNNAVATGNDFGAEVDAAGNVAITGGNFSNNRQDGLGAWSLSSGDVTLNNVIATGNGRDGAFAHAYNGNVTVNGGNFSNNRQGGLFVHSGGIATFNNVTAIGNGSGDEYSYGAGAYGSLDVICGNYSGNDGYGLWLSGGNVYLGGPNLDRNTLGAYYQEAGTISFGKCGESGGRGFKPQNNLLPLLPISQVVAEMTSLTLEQLPADLPEGKIFVSELTVTLMLDGEEVNEAPDGVQVAFDIPDNAESTIFTVLFWNGTAWVEVPSTVVGGQVVFTVTQPGIYVLATQ